MIEKKLSIYTLCIIQYTISTDNQHKLTYEKYFSGHLEQVRTELATKHAQNVINHELKQKDLLKERQQVFQEAFNTDLETFKELGAIPSMYYIIKNRISVNNFTLFISFRN